jgi:hypothetical protein
MPKSGHIVQFDQAKASANFHGDGKSIDKGVRNALVLLALCLVFLTLVFAHGLVHQLRSQDARAISVRGELNAASADRPYQR